jgi:hypothetical protein
MELELEEHSQNNWECGEMVTPAGGGYFAITQVNSSDIFIWNPVNNTVKVLQIKCNCSRKCEIAIRQLGNNLCMCSTDYERKQNYLYLIDISTGRILKTHKRDGDDFSFLWSASEDMVIVDHMGSTNYEIYNHNLDIVLSHNIDRKDVQSKNDIFYGPWKQINDTECIRFDNSIGEFEVFSLPDFSTKGKYKVSIDEKRLKDVKKQILSSEKIVEETNLLRVDDFISFCTENIRKREGEKNAN